MSCVSVLELSEQNVNMLGEGREKEKMGKKIRFGNMLTEKTMELRVEQKFPTPSWKSVRREEISLSAFLPHV